MRMEPWLPSWLAEQERPWIVLDLNLLRARRPLPATGAFVIPDILAAEVCTSDNPEVSIRVLEEALRAIGPHRLLVARYWHELSRREAPRALVPPGEIVQPKYTLMLAKALSGRRPGLVLDDTDIGQYERDRAAFVGLAKRFSVWMDSAQKNRLKILRNEPASMLEFIQGPAIHCQFIARNMPRYSSPDWQKVLAAFPDRAAIGRWTRIALWYAAQYAVGKTRKFENNYDDSHYLFTASYTRYLATNDARLKEAASALFPQIRCISM